MGMDLGMDKCSIYHLSRSGADDVAEDVRLVYESIIRHLDAEKCYKFLDVMQIGVQGSLRNRYNACLRQI